MRSVAIYTCNEINRADMQREVTDSHSAQAGALMLVGAVDARLAPIRERHNATIGTNVHAFRKFLAEALCPEVNRALIGNFPTFESGFLQTGPIRDYFMDYQLRDALFGINKMSLQTKETIINLAGFSEEGIENLTMEKTVTGSLVKFQSPLACSLAACQALENLSFSTFAETVMAIFGEIRIIVVTSDPGITISVWSLKQFGQLMSFVEFLSFLAKFLNTSGDAVEWDFYAIRGCLASQLLDLYNRRSFRTFPVLFCGTAEIAAVQNAEFNFIPDTQNVDRLAFETLVLPNHAGGNVPLFLTFFDIVSSSVEVSSHHNVDFDGYLVGEKATYDNIRVADSLRDELRSSVRIHPYSDNRQLAILNNYGIAQITPILSNNVVMHSNRNRIRQTLYNQLDFMHIVRMTTFLPSDQAHAFISMFFDAVQVTYLFNLRCDANNQERDRNKSCALGVYFNHFLSPLLYSVINGNVLDSLRACIAYGLVNVTSVSKSEDFAIATNVTPSIYLFSANTKLTNISVDQVYSLQISKFLDQLLYTRDSDFFYKDVVPDSFKSRLRMWLELYVPGFLKPPVVNPYTVISNPFIRSSISNDTVLPNRQYVMPVINRR